MDDLISRQGAIDLLKQMRKDGDMVPWEGKDVFARIRKLPSAQPERKEWIVKDKMMDGEGPGTIILVCPDCGYEVWCAADDGPNFCPNCGADLRGDDDDKS